MELGDSQDYMEGLETAGSERICSKNGLETRVLSIQASGSAEIRVFKPQNATNKGFRAISRAWEAWKRGF